MLVLFVVFELLIIEKISEMGVHVVYDVLLCNLMNGFVICNDLLKMLVSMINGMQICVWLVHVCIHFWEKWLIDFGMFESFWFASRMYSNLKLGFVVFASNVICTLKFSICFNPLLNQPKLIPEVYNWF